MKIALRLTFIMLIASFATKAQTILNSSFEAWTPYTITAGSGEDPNAWSTSDQTILGYSGSHSAVKTTDAFSGGYAIQMTSWLALGTVKGPGIATNGTISNLTPVGGTADTTRSRYLTGEYKYAPAASTDSAVVSVYLFHGTSRDTIAAGVLALSTASTYTQFIVPLVYRDLLTQPDTFLILLQSSKGTVGTTTIVPGSSFTVDSLNFSGTVGIDEAKDQLVYLNLYPNPASQFITIDAKLKSSSKLKALIYDASGRLAMESSLSDDRQTIDVSALANGNYVLHLFSNEKSVTSKQFQIRK
ncbi:MAG: T9SS type A sorting domain-containing protein [Bacteroidia bacterium]